MERAASDNDMTADDSVRRSRWRRKRWAALLVVLGALLLAGLGLWLSRERIVDDIIRDQLEAYDIPGSYTIERIGGTTQILSNVVLGDPDNPDFTAERLVVTLRHRFGIPEIGGVVLVKPRLYASYRDGELSLGRLDPLVFGGDDSPASLPNLNFEVRDGRALLATDYGPVGIKLA
ncbi:MAG TPA: exoprotein, partial [Erythrobacter sp.]|nr:exoprotein [Erythrobacter sp.]